MKPPRVHSARMWWWLLVLPLVGDACGAEEPSWLRLVGNNAVVVHKPGDEKNAALVLELAEAGCSTVKSELGLVRAVVVQVVLAPSADEFTAMTYHQLPRWAAGVTALEAEGPVIYLPSPRWGARGGELHQTILHEVAHALVAVASDFRPLPRWMAEGLAIHFSREQQWTSPAQVSRALLTNSLMSLEEIEQLNTVPEHKARVAYQQSFLAVEYLLHTYGPAAMRTILTRIGQGEDVDAAFEHAIDRDTWEFQQEWLDYARRRYRWTFLAELDWALWGLVLFLAAAAFVAVRYRARRTMRAWEEEPSSAEDEQPWENE